MTFQPLALWIRACECNVALIGGNMYTAQIDRHGNIIVCKGDRERNGYRIFFVGSYNECLNRKVSA
jgi:hypothetical protein